MTECGICTEDKYLYELPCGDKKFCHSCLSRYIRDQVYGAKVAELICPDPACEDRIPYILLGNFIDDDTIGRLDRNILKQAQVEDDQERGIRRIQCPECELELEIDNDANHFDCNRCDERYCTKCFEEWDHDHECEVLEELMDALGLNDEELRHCPYCSIPLYKEEGCHSMICGRCERKFCWNCMKVLNGRREYRNHEDVCEGFDGYESDEMSDTDSDDTDSDDY